MTRRVVTTLFLRQERYAGVTDGARSAVDRLDLLRGDHVRFQMDPQRLRDARAVGRICLGAVGDMALLNVLLSDA